MSKPTPPESAKKTMATAACVFELALDAGGGVKPEAHLLPAGYFRADDGRPHCCAAWYIDDTIAGQVIARMAARKNPTLIDYEHQSLKTEVNGQPALAAGWFKVMEFREAGLYAVGVQWTENAAAKIAAKEILFVSAVFSYYEETGEVLDILSATITNSPALDGLDELAALTKRLSTTQGDTMPDPTTIAALTAERDTLKTREAALVIERDGLQAQVTALTADKTALATKVTALEKEKAELAQGDEKKRCDELITAALNSGKILPVHKAYLEKRPLAELQDYLEHVAGVPLALLSKQHAKEPGTGSAALTKEEQDMCVKMGVSVDEFLKTKGGK